MTMGLAEFIILALIILVFLAIIWAVVKVVRNSTSTKKEVQELRASLDREARSRGN